MVLDVDDIEKVVMKDWHIISYERGEEWDFPETDHSNFMPDCKEMVDELVGVVQELLTAPYITDDFRTETERWAWKKTLDPAMIAFLDRNILRTSRIGLLVMGGVVGPLLHEYCGRHVATLYSQFGAATRQQQLFDNHNLLYDELRDDEKILLAKNVKMRYFEILRLLADPATPYSR